MIKVSLKRSIDKLHICKFGNRITKINRTHWYNHLPSFGPAHLSITVTRRTPKLIFLDVHTDWPARLKHRLSTRKSEFWSWKINDQWWEQGRHVFRFLAVSVEPKKSSENEPCWYIYNVPIPSYRYKATTCNGARITASSRIADISDRVQWLFLRLMWNYVTDSELCQCQ